MELKSAHTAAADGYWADVEALVMVDALLEVDSLPEFLLLWLFWV